MSNLPSKLREWADHYDHSHATTNKRTAMSSAMLEAADEIERLVAEKASDWKAACESARLASSEIARLRLTDAEREAVEAAIGWIESPGAEDEAMPEDYLPITATLRGLLGRMK